MSMNPYRYSPFTTLRELNSYLSHRATDYLPRAARRYDLLHGLKDEIQRRHGEVPMVVMGGFPNSWWVPGEPRTHQALHLHHLRHLPKDRVMGDVFQASHVLRVTHEGTWS